MDDDINSTVPLTSSQAPLPSTPQSTVAHSLRWFHYIFIFLLGLAVVICLFVSITTPRVLILTVPILVFSIHAARIFLKRHRPPSVPTPFLVTQATLGAFVAPLQYLLIIIPVLFIVGICVALLAFLIAHVFSVLHPDFKWESISSHGKTLVSHLSRFSSLNGLWSSAVESLQGTHAASRIGSTAPPETLSDLISLVWNALVNAKIPRFHIVLLILVSTLLYLGSIIAFIVINFAVREWVKWFMLSRYVKTVSAENNDRDFAAGLIRTSGIVAIGCTGAFAWNLSTFATSTILVSWILRHPDLVQNAKLSTPRLMYSVFLIILNIVVFVGSQAFVATAHAERVLHGSEVPMKKAFITSVSYNSIFVLLPLISESCLNLGWVTWVVWVAVLVLQVSIVWRFSRMTVERYTAAVQADGTHLARSLGNTFI